MFNANKMRIFVKKHGAKGYGIFMLALEYLLYRDDMSVSDIVKNIAKTFAVSEEEVETMLESCSELGLLTYNKRADMLFRLRTLLELNEVLSESPTIKSLVKNLKQHCKLLQPIQICNNTIANQAREVFEYYVSKINKPKVRYSDARKYLIMNKLKQGYSVDDLKMAIDNFVKHGWGLENGYWDLVYVIGQQRGKRDNLEYYLAYKKNTRKKKDVFEINLEKIARGEY